MVKIVDTTLRDGLQTPGIFLPKEVRFEIAKLIKLSGIYEIEAGIPASGECEITFIKKAINELEDENFKIITWNRGKTEDIRTSLKCGANRVNISFPVSEIMLKTKINKSRNWLLKQLKVCLEFAKEKELYVSVGCEDATRADRNFLTHFIGTAKEYGADRVRIADTVGITEPFRFKNFIETIKKEVQIELEVHAHNDFGMATANTLAGIEGGAEYFSGTLAGIGERAGNAAIEQVVAALNFLYKVNTGIKMKKLLETVKFFLKEINRKIPDNMPLLGENISTHKSGIHIDGVLKNPGNYMPFDPKIVGKELKFYIGYFSGRKSFYKLINKLNIDLSQTETEKLYFKIFESSKPFTLKELKEKIEALKEN